MARPRQFPTERDAEYQARVLEWELRRIAELRASLRVSDSAARYEVEARVDEPEAT